MFFFPKKADVNSRNVGILRFNLTAFNQCDSKAFLGINVNTFNKQ